MSQEQEKKQTKKKKRPHRFSEPHRRMLRLKTNHRCPRCQRVIRVNRRGFLSWHRGLKSDGKWCPASRTHRLPS